MLNLVSHGHTPPHIHTVSPTSFERPTFGPSRGAYDILVFYSPVEDGHVVMIVLKDLNFFAEASGKGLEVVSSMVSWPQLAERFTKVTGQKAEYRRETLQQWGANFENSVRSVGIQGGVKSTTFRQLLRMVGRFPGGT